MPLDRLLARAKPSGRSGTSPATSQRGRPHFVERAAWVAVALLTLGLFVASVPAFYE